MATLNLATLLREPAAEQPDAVALVQGDTGWTYRDLDDRARRLAAGLLDLGIRPGQHVALLFANQPDFTLCYFACHYAGLVVVPLNVMLTAEEIGFHLDDADVVALLVADDLLPAARTALARAETCKHLVVGLGPREDTLLPPGTELVEALSAPGRPPVAEPAATGPDDTAVILYTSGTTGRPKGAELTHFNLYWNAHYVARHFLADGPPPVSLAALPFFHSFGQTAVQNATFVAGGTVVLLPRFDAGAALALIDRHRVSYFAGVPTMYFGLLHHPEATRYDLSSLRRCISGGAAMPVEVLREFDRRHGVDILEGYGLSETSPVASQNRPDRPKKPGSIGLPLRGVEFRLVGDDGRTIEAPEVPGEIWIRGPVVMKGYYKRPEATADTVRDGWLRTGDVAQRDADGFYFIVDRKKDMVIRGGYNVYPREIEEVLYGHPAVMEAAVIGVPEPRLGEEVKAVVVLKRGAGVTAEELIAYCRSRLAAYKYPRRVEFVAALPKGPTGKILKRMLRSG